MSEDDRAVLSRAFAGLTTGQVSDALSLHGLPALGLLGIRPMEPALSFAGPAFTVQCSVDAIPDERIEYLDDVRAGDAIVIANSGRLHCSVWGGQRSLGASQRGAVGTVVDGAYRDVGEHRLLRYPVYGLATAVAGSSTGGVRPIASNVPVRIGESLVDPGDWIVADDSGVVVVPGHDVEKIVVSAERLAAAEARVIAAVASGGDFLVHRSRERAAKPATHGTHSAPG